MPTKKITASLRKTTTSYRSRSARKLNLSKGRSSAKGLRGSKRSFSKIPRSGRRNSTKRPPRAARNSTRRSQRGPRISGKTSHRAGRSSAKNSARAARSSSKAWQKANSSSSKTRQNSKNSSAKIPMNEIPQNGHNIPAETTQNEDWKLHDSCKEGFSFRRIVTRSQTAFCRMKRTESNLNLFGDGTSYTVNDQPNLMEAVKGKYGIVPRTIVTRSSGQFLTPDDELNKKLEFYKGKVECCKEEMESTEDVNFPEKKEEKEAPDFFGSMLRTMGFFIGVIP